MENHKLGYTVEEYAAVSGIGRTKVFEAIKTGMLKARKVGRRTIIEHDDGVAFLKSLPVREVQEAA